MGVKKIKISELPLADTLVGLYTIGVNALNKSVKVVGVSKNRSRQGQ